MAIFKYDEVFGYPQQAPTFGDFWIWSVLDIPECMKERSKSNPYTALAAGDDFRGPALRDKWVIRHSIWRLDEAFAASTTLDIGVTQGGTELVNAADGTDTATYGDWVECSYVSGAVGSLTSDTYLWIEVNVTTPTIGKLAVGLNIVCGMDDNENYDT